MAKRNAGVLKILPYILFVVVMSFSGPAFPAAEEKLEKIHHLNKDGKVHVKNISGNITVSVWDKSEVKINIHKVARNAEDLANTTVSINGSQEAIRIATKHQKKLSLSRSTHVSVHYALTVPKQAHVKIETISGSIHVTNVEGYIEVRSISGEINVTGAKNGVKSKSISGCINLEDVTGNIDQRTASGEVTVVRAVGMLEIETVSGNIDMKGVSHAEKVEIMSIAGNIRMHGKLNPTGTYELTSHSGAINLDIPKGAGFELQTLMFSGELFSDFELKILGGIKHQKFHGVAGEGGANLILSSFSGDIHLDKMD